ncbi:hypothetical protein [Nostoc sp. MS1]|uniref:hypothetical protein n=1 Tax=Nostoc sp. MS1 TaxID=2764711 RepID=UPI001CC74040|nr:hypothetical protein [Nostoc sp. MS1]BCL38277.1 hypothetical protein NSMS1_47240 [Nostoc sp. MS1]
MFARIYFIYMKSFSQSLAILASSLGLLSINAIIALPAHASIVCGSGTISNYQNGSLASCILDQDTTVQVSHSNTGTANFYCQAKKLISFDDKGQFQSCYLYQEIQIRKDNLVETCPTQYRVSILASTKGIESISCSPY